MPATPSQVPSRHRPPGSVRVERLVLGIALGLLACAAAQFLPRWGLGITVGTAAVLLAWVLDRWRRRRRALASSDQPFPATLHEQAARMRAIVDTATEGIVAIDERGTIDTFNGAAERLFGWSAKEVIGRNVNMLMPSPDHERHDGYLLRYLQTGERRIIGIGREVIGLRKDGTSFPIDLSVGEGRTGGVRFFTAVIRDITERKEMQARLAQTERLAAVGELAAGVAHEVNNPINTIINSAQLMMDGDPAEEHTSIILEEGQRIADIVSDLLQFARGDRDSPQPTILTEVVQRTVRLVGENFKRHGIALQVDVDQDLPLVRARPQQLQQVLLNLLINAKDALLQDTRPRPRSVRLGVAPSAGGDTVLLSVRDSGPGIPADLGERIFEPFVTTKRARGGTGLGLSISRTLVEGFGGSLTVVSSPEGADFRVVLPVIRDGDDG